MGEVTAGPQAAESPHLLHGLVGPYQTALKGRRGPRLPLYVPHRLRPLEAEWRHAGMLAGLGILSSVFSET